MSAKEVHQLAMQGNQQAVKSYERAGYYLGIGIANLLNLLNPRKVILGGGVLRSVHPVFWRTLKKSAGQHAWPEAFKTVQIVRSKLIGRSGHLGALALVFKNQRP